MKFQMLNCPQLSSHWVLIYMHNLFCLKVHSDGSSALYSLVGFFSTGKNSKLFFLTVELAKVFLAVYLAF